jgi:hypothetical protein
MFEHDWEELARKYDAYVKSDGNGFRRVARVQQSLWRESKGLPIGEHDGLPLGSRLPVDYAKDTLANYLTPIIKRIIRSELSSSSDGRLFATPRIYNDLLSSQPLCFNLFGELKADLDLATATFKILRPNAVKAVRAVEFEYSPSRSDPRFTADRSAFDVFVEYEAPDGSLGFIGIEVKYHENLKDSPAVHRDRYDQIAAAMGCFRKETLPGLQVSPLQQIWRDHLLAGIMQQELDYSEGVFVFLYPAPNVHCRSVVQKYCNTIRDCRSFMAWTLEEVVAVLSVVTTDSWVRDFRERYLDFGIGRMG